MQSGEDLGAQRPGTCKRTHSGEGESGGRLIRFRWLLGPGADPVSIRLSFEEVCFHGSMFRVILASLWMVIAVPATLPGLAYYLTPLQERPFVPGHDLFASSAIVGHGYGVLGAAMMLVGVVGYALRRRVPALSRLGKLRRWLQVHIFLCTLGPYLVVLHTTFRIGGIVAIAFWSMILVVASGVFGRYVYVRIPKTIQGHFLTLEALEARRDEAAETIRSRFGLGEGIVDRLLRDARPPRPEGPAQAIVLALRWDLGHRRALRQLERILDGIGASSGDRKDLAGLLREEGLRELQIALLHPFQRLFRYWHVFHLPLAIVMLLILGVHVSVAVLFGYVWVL